MNLLQELFGGSSSNSAAGGGGSDLFSYLGGEDYDLGSRLAMAAAHLNDNPGVAAQIREKMLSRRESRKEAAREAAEDRRIADHIISKRPELKTFLEQNPKAARTYLTKVIEEDYKIREEGRAAEVEANKPENRYRTSLMKTVEAAPGAIAEKASRPWIGTPERPPNLSYLTKDPAILAVKARVPLLRTASDAEAGAYLEVLRSGGTVAQALERVNSMQSGDRDERRLGMEEETHEQNLLKSKIETGAAVSPYGEQVGAELEMSQPGLERQAQVPWMGTPQQAPDLSPLMQSPQENLIGQARARWGADLTHRHVQRMMTAIQQGPKAAQEELKAIEDDISNAELNRIRAKETGMIWDPATQSFRQGGGGGGKGENVTDAQRRAGLLAFMTKSYDIQWDGFQDLTSLANTVGSTGQKYNDPTVQTLSQGAMSGPGQKAYTELTNLAQDYIFGISGMTATEREVARIINSIMPNFFTAPGTLESKWNRVNKMVAMLQKGSTDGQALATARLQQWMANHPRASAAEQDDAHREIAASVAEMQIRQIANEMPLGPAGGQGGQSQQPGIDLEPDEGPAFERYGNKGDMFR